ncbi:MAG: exodeoxyribonuclease VII large subunit [Pseudomonadota bacterium]
MRISLPGPESRIYRPAELNQEVRLHLEAGFPRLWIEAELSNLARPASGHLYFTLKDPRAQIRCALFKGNARGLAFRPENGQKVLVRGRLSLYEARGDYQLIADAMLEAGAGSLQQAFEAFRKALEAEGLFEAERKQPIPAWPKQIAVVTSPSGAAIQDILKVLSHRWPAAEVRIYRTLVQGEAAAPEITRALRAADRHAFGDVIILARGGGSIEDLWAFNDESLARAVADCQKPVVTGVGHETDTTIVDFVADLRAPTPSAAAAAITPDGPSLKLSLRTLERRHARGIEHALNRFDQTLDQLQRRLDQHQPERHLREMESRLQQLTSRLQRAQKSQKRSASTMLASLDVRLQSQQPRRQIDAMESGLHQMRDRLHRARKITIDQAENRLGQMLRQLNAVSPLKVLERGYGVIRDKRGQALTQSDDFIKGNKINILMNEFEVDAEIKSDTRPARLP